MSRQILEQGTGPELASGLHCKAGMCVLGCDWLCLAVWYLLVD